VTSVSEIVASMMRNSRAVRFADLVKVCNHYFGKPRSRGTSHHVYRTPWQGDPRVNIQNAKGQAKAYQVGQVLWAIERIEKDSGKDD
jgi:hypothetical protein